VLDLPFLELVAPLLLLLRTAESASQDSSETGRGRRNLIDRQRQRVWVTGRL